MHFLFLCTSILFLHSLLLELREGPMKMVIEYIGGSPLSDDVITIKKKEKREDFSELELSSKEVQGEFIHLCTEFISKGPEAGFELAELSSVIFK